MNLNGQAFFSTRCWNPIIPPTREHQKEEEEEGEGDGLSVGDNIPYPPPPVVFGKILVKPPVPTRMDGFYYNFVEDRGITKIYNEY